MTHLVTEASTVHAISKHPTVDNHDLTSLTQIISSSSSLSKETSRSVIKRIPRLKRISQCEWTLYTLADTGEGPGRPAPLVFRLNWGPRGRKSFFCDHPPPPPYLEVWMRHWYEHMTLSLSLPSLYCPYFLLLFPSPSFASLPLLFQWQSFHRVFFSVHFTLNIIQYNLRTVEACVAEQSTPRTLVGGSSLAHRVVSLDKEVYCTLSLFTQVYKWMSATYCLGVTLRWASMPSRGE